LGLSKPKKVLRGLELHEYLKAKIAVPNTINDIPVPNIEMNGILFFLKQGYEVLQNLNARDVGAALTLFSPVLQRNYSIISKI